jgi:DNA-binding beta-propeller fold protein YncE
MSGRGLAALTFAAALSFALPAAGSAAAPSVYITDDVTGGGVFQLGADGAGQLAPLTPPVLAAGSLPVGVVVSSDGTSAYVANRGNGGQIFQYDVGADGALVPKTPPSVSAPGTPAGLAVSPDGDSVYAANYTGLMTGGLVQQFDADADGKLTPKNPPTLPTGRESIGIAVAPDGKTAYIASAGAVHQFAIGLGGALVPKAPATVPGPANPRELVVSPDGSSVYVGDVSSPGAIFQYSAAANGVLTAKNPPSVAVNPVPGLAFHPAGRHLYAASRGDVTYQFDIGPTGALAPMNPPSIDLPGAADVAVSPNGLHAYVINGQTVAQLDIGAEGALARKTPFTRLVADEAIAITTAGEWPPAPPRVDPDPPANDFLVGAPKRNRRMGTARLPVSVPGPGELTLARTNAVKGAAARAEADGSLQLTVKARGNAKRKLARTAAAKVTARVTFLPDGGEAATRSKRLKLKLAR